MTNLALNTATQNTLKKNQSRYMYIYISMLFWKKGGLIQYHKVVMPEKMQDRLIYCCLPQCCYIDEVT